MIKLDIHEYCHDCQGFDPCIETQTIHQSDASIVRKTIITTIQCKSHKRCGSIERYLIRWKKAHEELK